MSAITPTNGRRYGHLAYTCSGIRAPLVVMKSAAGFYLGTYGEDGPLSRESAEYFPTKARATQALETGEWTQREHP
jgi:hypothetical protein